MMAARVGVHRKSMALGGMRSVLQNAGTFTTGTDEPSTNNAYRRLRFLVPACPKDPSYLTIELSNHATSFLSAASSVDHKLYDSKENTKPGSGAGEVTFSRLGSVL